MDETLRRIERRSRKSIFHALLAASHRRGANAVAGIDGDGRALTYKEIIRASFALGGPLARATSAGEKVGIMLPTGAGAVIALMAAFTYVITRTSLGRAQRACEQDQKMAALLADQALIAEGGTPPDAAAL